MLRNHETEQAVHGPALPRPGAGLEMHPIDQADRTRLPEGRGRDRLLQHHEVLHRGLPGAHQDHRQRDHPAQGARRRQVLRPDPDGLAEAPRRRRRDRAAPLPVTPGPDAAAFERRRRPAAADARGPGMPGEADARRGFVVRTDGAARGNPGPASAGAVLIDCAAPRRARPAGPARRDDLRVPRRPDEQRRRVHRRRPGARPRARARRAARSRCSSTRS